MKQIKKLLLFIILCNCTKQTPQKSDELSEISFHRGYECWEKHLKIEGMPYDFDQIISGIKAAEKGDPPHISKERAMALTLQFEEVILNEQVTNNLREAESYLGSIAKDSIEVESNKLYYKVVKKGSGRFINPDGIAFMKYRIQTLQDGKIEEFSDSGDFPIEISILDTIPGFAMGVVGMQEGEERTLYIHPDLGYGVSGVKLKPNKILIVNLTLDHISAEASGKLADQRMPVKKLKSR